MPTPEEQARQKIDALLDAAGWAVQDRNAINLGAAMGVAVREFPLATGYADYLLFVDRKAVGVIEAKPEGTTLSGVAEQSAAYLTGLPPNIPHVQLPLPFACESTGVETYFRDERDPDPRSRRVFAFHQPETLGEWAAEADTLRARLKQMPPLMTKGLWDAQVEAVRNLEQSFAQNRPRALVQMATGSGKTFTSVTAGVRHDELMARDRVNLDIFWLRDESLEDTTDLADPDVLAAEIVEDLQVALEQFRETSEDMGEGDACPSLWKPERWDRW